MKILNKIITLMLIIIISAFVSIYPVCATEIDIPEKEENEEENIISEKVIENNLNFTSKDYEIKSEPKNKGYLVEGGNKKAINMLATKPNDAKGTLTENVGVTGEQYNMELKSEEDIENSNPLELRQFITFETKSGKIFHLMIDHSKSEDNVMMLTEVSEQDLLNLIEEQAEVDIELSEPKVSEEKEESAKDNADASVDNETEEQTGVSTEVKKFIFVIIVAAITGAIGWYIKIYKPKKYAQYDEEDEDDEEGYYEEDN